MKKIFKFFPLALVAVAMASCSSDDLNGLDGTKELTYSPDKLLVQVGEFDETTRGGFMTTVYDYNLKSALFFSTGDQMKLYHDSTSWKKEIWTAREFGQYKNAQGIAVFDGPDPQSTIVTSENAYGIFPASIGQFGNEDRTSIQYDLSAMKFIDYSAVATKYVGSNFTVDNTGATKQDATDNTKAYAAPFPLWGVKQAGSELMTVQHLGGILRVDLAHVDLAGMGVNDAKFIIIKSANVLSGKVATAADLLNPTDAEKVDVANLMTKAPKLVTTAAGAATTIQDAAFPITAAGIKDDAIVVKLTKNDPEHVMLFVPITAGNAGGDIQIYVSGVYNLTANPATINTASDDELAAAKYTLTADKIAEENDLQVKNKTGKDLTKVQPGVFYRINDDSSNINDEAKTPFQLAEGIIAADKAAYRDFEITFTQPIEVKNNDDSPQNFLLNLAGGNNRYGLIDGYVLKHNVTVHLTLKESDDAGTVPSVLYISTKEGSKKMTLDITNDAKKVDSIVVKTGELKSELVLKEHSGAGQLPNIHIGNSNHNKVTLVSGSKYVKTNSNMTIKTNQNAGDNIDVFVLAEGVSQTNIIGGRLSGIYVAATDPIKADATIYTEGKVGIGLVNYSNMKKTNPSGTNYTDSHNLIFRSKWTGETTTQFAVAQLTDGTTTIDNAILTAAQLSGATVAGTAYTVLGNYDLNGDNAEWISLPALTKSVSGAQFFRFGTDKTKAAGARAITGNANIENLTGANGLIAKWTPAAANDAISNITFTGGCAVKGANGASKIGLLVGEVVNSSAAGIIKNDSVKGTNTIEGQGTGAGIGGVIGKITDATNALTIANVVVSANTTKVKGFKYVGGIVGEVAGKVIFAAASKDLATLKTTTAADFANNDVYNKSAAALETYRISSTAPASENLPTKGQFFGGASVLAANGDVTILGALTKANPALTDGTWGYYLSDNNHESWVWPATLYYNEIGLCGYDVDGAYATGFSVIQKTGYAAIVNLTENTTTHKYATSTNLVTSVGKTAPDDGTPAGTKYFSWVKNPQE